MGGQHPEGRPKSRYGCRARADGSGRHKGNKDQLWIRHHKHVPRMLRAFVQEVKGLAEAGPALSESTIVWSHVASGVSSEGLESPGGGPSDCQQVFSLCPW